MRSSGNLYGTRTCLHCNKKFDASYPAQITCSKQCRIARRLALDRHRKKRWRDILLETIEWINCQLEEAIAARKRYNARGDTVVKAPETKAENKSENKTPSREKHRHICVNCGSTFKSAHKEDSYCCDECAKEFALGGIG